MKPPRWTIRTMFVAIFLVALFFTGVLWERSRVQTRATAISAVDQLHGTYGIRYIGSKSYRKFMGYVGAEPKGFYDPARVSLGPNNLGYDPATPIRNEDIKALAPHLAEFDNLECLDLQNCDLVTDAAIRWLPDFPKLTMMRVAGTGLSEHGILALREKYPNAEITR